MAGKKRKRNDESTGGSYNNESRSKPSVEARIDPTYGQRSAIPGLDDDTIMEGDESDLNFDEDADALAYLRSVRHEASSIPNLLVAPRSTPASENEGTSEDGLIDNRGKYEDGAYVAQADPFVDGLTPTIDDGDSHIPYFDSILSRYEILHSQLQQTPPLDMVQNLGDDHPTHINGKMTAAIARWWRWKMRTVDPKPAQITLMNKNTVLKLLGLLTGGTLLKRGAQVEVGVSAWAWALLARLPDRGELNSEEIGVVRELGKKAVLVGTGLKQNANWEEGILEVEAGLDSANMAVDDEERAVNNGDNDDNPWDSDADVDVEDDSEYLAEPETNPLKGKDHIRQVIGPELPNEAESVQFESKIEHVNNGTKSSDQTSSDSAPTNGDILPVSLDLAENGQFGTQNKHVDDSSEEGEIQSEEEPDTAEDLAAAKSRIMGLLNHAEPMDVAEKIDLDEEAEKATARAKFAAWNTKATVDMIITIAGEIYGQRDLLEFRSTWAGEL